MRLCFAALSIRLITSGSFLLNSAIFLAWPNLMRLLKDSFISSLIARLNVQRLLACRKSLIAALMIGITGYTIRDTFILCQQKQLSLLPGAFGGVVYSRNTVLC